jgi:hypothetical protein
MKTVKSNVRRSLCQRKGARWLALAIFEAAGKVSKRASLDLPTHAEICN